MGPEADSQQRHFSLIILAAAAATKGWVEASKKLLWAEEEAVMNEGVSLISIWRAA